MASPNKHISLYEVQAVTPTAKIQQQTSHSINTFADEKYLQVTKLTKSNAGSLIDRKDSIYSKLASHPRMLEREDLAIMHEISKAQRYGIIVGTLSTGSFFLSVYSKRLRGSAQLAALSISLLGWFTSGVGLSHSSFRFAKFMHYLNYKYFYGQTLNELKDASLSKTNKPKRISFEETSWNLKNKLPDMRAWMKLD
jgi:hypothetical protein